MEGWLENVARALSFHVIEKFKLKSVVRLFSGITGADTTVCIIDDGLDYTHPDLKEAFVSLGGSRSKWWATCLKT